MRKKFKIVLRRLKARKKIDLVLDYVSMGLELDSLELDMSLDSFVSLIHDKKYSLLKEHLSPYDILNYMKEYQSFQYDLVAQFFKEGMYTLVLLVAAYALSWFFLGKFSVSVLEMVLSFDVDVSMIYRYQRVTQMFLWLVHVCVIVLIVFYALFQSLDLRILFYIKTHQRFKFLRDFVTYRYAMVMSLFLKYGVKTQFMIGVMRHSSLDSFSRWLSYHVEDDLLSGRSFSESLNQSYFDPKFVLLVDQGLRRHCFEVNVNRYLDMVKKSIAQHLKRFMQVFKLIVFMYLLILMAMFYSVLYLPMQIMEVL